MACTTILLRPRFDFEEFSVLLDITGGTGSGAHGLEKLKDACEERLSILIQSTRGGIFEDDSALTWKDGENVFAVGDCNGFCGALNDTAYFG